MNLNGSTVLSFFCPGTPRPQGSKRAFKTLHGKVVMIESSPKTRQWRALVTGSRDGRLPTSNVRHGSEDPHTMDLCRSGHCQSYLYFPATEIPSSQEWRRKIGRPNPQGVDAGYR